MEEPLIDQVVWRIKHAAELYHRLVLLVVPTQGGETSVLREVAKMKAIQCQYINLNLELSHRLLDLTERQRLLQVPRFLGDIVAKSGDSVVLLDNLEILFDISLRQDPLRLLQGLSRNRTVVVRWKGAVVDGFLTYAAPDHPEHRRYPIDDLLIVREERAV